MTQFWEKLKHMSEEKNNLKILKGNFIEAFYFVFDNSPKLETIHESENV